MATSTTTHTTYQESYTVSSSSSSRLTGMMDKQYYRGIPGLIKAVEVIASLIAYICIEVEHRYCGNLATYDFFKFITLFAFATTLILYFILLFKLPTRILRCDCATGKWPLFELGYYVVIIIFYFFGDLFLSIQGCLSAHKAGVFFGWLALAGYILDTVYLLYCFMRGRTSSSSHTTTTTTQGSAPDDKY